MRADLAMWVGIGIGVAATGCRAPSESASARSTSQAVSAAPITASATAATAEAPAATGAGPRALDSAAIGRLAAALRSAQASEGLEGGDHAPALPALEAVPCTKKLSVRAVDDSAAPKLDAIEAKLPKGARVAREMVSVAEGVAVDRSYVVIEGAPGEIAKGEEAVRRLVKPLLPEGRDVAFGPEKAAGVRSYVVGACVIGQSHVASARGIGEREHHDAIEIILTAEGKTRFASATRALVKRRIAVMVDDVARMVPVVLGALDSGRIELWLPNEREAEAVVKRISP